MLPYATLEPVRELLLQQFMGEKFGRDSIWETHLANELWETDVELDAVLDQLVISLNDVVKWKPGSQMMLNAGPASPIELRCGEIPLFVGSMGQKGGNMAIKVNKKLRNM